MQSCLKCTRNNKNIHKSQFFYLSETDECTKSLIKRLNHRVTLVYFALLPDKFHHYSQQFSNFPKSAQFFYQTRHEALNFFFQWSMIEETIFRSSREKDPCTALPLGEASVPTKDAICLSFSNIQTF